jgi:hypothetical protein
LYCSWLFIFVGSCVTTFYNATVRRGVTVDGVIVGNETKIEGKLKDKKVYLAISSSGIYTEGHLQSYDFVFPLIVKIIEVFLFHR